MFSCSGVAVRPGDANLGLPLFIPKGVERVNSPFGKRGRAPALMPESLLRQ